MGLPGVIVESRATSARRGEPTDTGVGFLVDFTEWGPHDAPVEVRSLDEFEQIFGDRVAYSLAYDSLELAFAEGLANCFVSRQVGPAPVKASSVLVDRAGAPINTLRIDAIHVGDRGNRISREVVAGGPANTFTLIIRFDGVEVERFSDLATPAAAVAATANSSYVRAVDLGSATAAPNNIPAIVGNAVLAGGTDDHASATQAQFTAALDRITKDYGPGQVCAPGRTANLQHVALIDHASTRNRTAVLDAPDKASRATMLADVAQKSALANSPYAEYIGTWFDIPGIAGGPSRAVPGSAYALGVTARTDALEGTAGAAAAGEVSTATYAIDIRVPDGGFTDADLAALNDGGVIMARKFRSRGIQLYGVRSITDQDAWEQITSNRLRMSLTAKLEAVALVVGPFKRIDAHGHLFGEYNGALAAVCKAEWEKDALYGETKDEAYKVDTGDTVNTPVTIAAKQIRARVGAKFSPTAEQAFIDLVKEPVP